MAVQNTIPASNYSVISPSVLSAGGAPPSMNGLYLDAGTRVPIGTVQSFGSAGAVGAYFGLNSSQFQDAQVYFSGFTIKTQTPGALLFAQYPWQAAVPAYLRGGATGNLSLAQLQALTPGTLTIVVEGVSWTSSSINLSTATSFSNAATIIQTALAINDAAFTGSIGAASASFTGVLASGVLTTTAVTGPIVPGATISGTGVTGSPTIVSQLTGTAGGAGTYQTSGTQTLSSVAMTSANANAGVLTVASGLTGTVAVGQVVAGSTTSAGTTITALLSGTGGVGTYVVSISQVVSSAALTSGAALVTYDSTASAFVITGGTPGAAGTIAFPTTNTLATGLLLTQATGAVTSQGSAIATPDAFMSALTLITQNFAAFAPNFEPSVSDKEAFSAWTSAQNDQFAFAMDSTEILLTESSDSGSSLATIILNGYSGTIPTYQTSYLHSAAFVMGSIASINFSATNGIATLAYKSSSLLTPSVTSLGVAQNLEANGCNYYGAVGNANNSWQFYFPGAITGPYKFVDAYVGQIWLNQYLQTAVVTLQTQVNTIPYTQGGYDLVSSALATPILAALNNGIITPGVVLSPSQIIEINDAAGNLQAANLVSSQGYFLQVGPGTPAQRAARATPPVSLWYAYGGSIQRINIASILVQ
jgi:hypothetical protein